MKLSHFNENHVLRMEHQQIYMKQVSVNAFCISM
jgi:hypothetical protein